MGDAIGGIVGGLGGGLIESGASQSAAKIQANAQLQAQQMADQTQMNMYNSTTQTLSPYVAAGNSALNTVQSDLAPGGSLAQNFTLSDLQVDPGYLFDLQQGNQAIQRSAAANGTLNSGGTLKAISNYTTGLASNEINNAYNRYTTDQTNQYNRLMGLVGTGEAAAGLQASANQSTGANIAQTQLATTTAAGNATAAGVMGQGNALGQAIANAGNTYTQYSTLNNLLGSLNSGSNTNLSGNSGNNVSGNSGGQSTLSQIGNWFGNLFN